MILEPKRLQMSKYKTIFEDIVSLLARRARQGYITHIHKVFSHLKTFTPHANEVVDGMATEVAKGLIEATVAEDTAPDPFKSMWWVRKKDGDMKYANDLNRSLKNMAAQHAKVGWTNNTIYTKAWEQIADKLHPSMHAGGHGNPME